MAMPVSRAYPLTSDQVQRTRQGPRFGSGHRTLSVNEWERPHPIRSRPVRSWREWYRSGKGVTTIRPGPPFPLMCDGHK